MDKPMSPLMKIAFWLVAVNALAGAASLIGFPTQTDTLFFWAIKPPINAALLGALYLGGATFVSFVTWKGEWEPARFLVPVLVSAGALISITSLLHLEIFDPGIKLIYWLIVYIGAPLLALLFYVQHERGGANWSITDPVKPVTRWLAVGLGSLLMLLGIGLILFPAGAVANWPWPMSPLMMRIYASWFSAFGAGLLWFWFDRDWQRLKHIANLMIAASGLDLLMIFIHRGDLTGTPLSIAIYCGHLALFGAIGTLMHWLQRK